MTLESLFVSILPDSLRVAYRNNHYGACYNPRTYPSYLLTRVEKEEDAKSLAEQSNVVSEARIEPETYEVDE